MGQYVRLEVEGGIGTIRLERPPMNALSTQVQSELAEAAREAGRRRDVAAVVVYGGEKVFAAGADIKEFQAMSYTDVVETGGALQDSFTAVARIPKPTVAAITGYALGGGCELALCCDFILASRTATFALPEVTRGIMPGGGGTQNLPRAVGERRAKELLMTGRPFTAEEAERWGMVNEVCEPEALMLRALETAHAICANAPISVRQIKKAVHQGLQTDLTTGLLLEVQAYERTIPTEDRREGVLAFNERRRPVFRGR